ncbi:hypothetical protein BN871_EO_00190 [Paenibacillus sp. P22]|nr:hypothetical protein BN871_EO_00190 [Paenibacillus sp. P22]
MLQVFDHAGPLLYVRLEGADAEDGDDSRYEEGDPSDRACQAVVVVEERGAVHESSDDLRAAARSPAGHDEYVLERLKSPVDHLDDRDQRDRLEQRPCNLADEGRLARPVHAGRLVEGRVDGCKSRVIQDERARKAAPDRRQDDAHERGRRAAEHASGNDEEVQADPLEQRIERAGGLEQPFPDVENRDTGRNHRQEIDGAVHRGHLRVLQGERQHERHRHDDDHLEDGDQRVVQQRLVEVLRDDRVVAEQELAEVRQPLEARRREVDARPVVEAEQDGEADRIHPDAEKQQHAGQQEQIRHPFVFCRYHLKNHLQALGVTAGRRWMRRPAGWIGT